MTIESAYSREFDGLLRQYEAFGYVVLDDGLIEAIHGLNERYGVKNG